MRKILIFIVAVFTILSVGYAQKSSLLIHTSDNDKIQIDEKQANEKQAASFPLSRGNVAYAKTNYPTNGAYVSFDVENPNTFTVIQPNWGLTYGGDYFDGDLYLYTENGTFRKIESATGSLIEEIPNVWSSYMSDMAFDFSTKTMYGVKDDALYTINIDTGIPTLVANLTGVTVLITLAVDLSGNMYGISGSSVNTPQSLYSVNKTTGECIEIGSTGKSANSAQSMGFDHNTGILYWCQYFYINNLSFCSVNTSTGLATTISSSYGREFTAFHVPFSHYNLEAPAKVNNITVTPDVSGALTAAISWVNPSQTFDGNELTSITSISIYENYDETPIYTVLNPTPGNTENYTVTVTTAGNYRYKIIAVNEAGEGPKSIDSAWIGLDVPEAPKNVILTKSTIDATVTWTEPTVGLHSAYFTPAGLVYDIYRMPDNILVSGNQTETTFSETITQPGMYFYKITAKNSSGDGGTANSNAVDFNFVIYTFPWTESFESQYFPPVGWEEHHAINSNRSWELYSAPIHSGNHSAGHWNSTIINQNSWLITPQIDLPASGVYLLEFWSAMDILSFYPTSGRSEIRISTNSNNPNSGDFKLIKYLWGDEVDYGMQKIIISLAEYTGMSIYIAFRYTGFTAHAWFIDDVAIKKFYDYDGAAVELLGNANPIVNEPFLYKAVIENKGVETLSSYTVKLVDENDNVLASNTTGADIASLEKLGIDLLYTPTSPGAASLRAVFEMLQDENPHNNVSAVLDINVQTWNDVFIDEIGTGTSTTCELPWYLYYKSSYVQTLYLQHELIAKDVAIVEVNYWYDFVQQVDMPIKIYMANTDLTDLSGGWIPEDELTLVFDGEVNFAIGQYVQTIQLDVPFIYGGKNLVIATVRPMDNVYYRIYNVFRYTVDHVYKNRNRFYFNETQEFNYSQKGNLDSRVSNVTLGMALVAGSASGTVTSDGISPIEGAKVQVVGRKLSKITDFDGKYNFPFLFEDDYQFEASKIGYFTATSTTVTVEENTNTIVPDIIIAPMDFYTVSGKITGNDAPEGLEGVVITLEGYNNYSVITDDTGNYTISKVYDDFTYNVTAIKEGYFKWTGTISINGNNVTFNFMMSEILIIPGNITAEMVDSNIELDWTEPGIKQYIYDDGTMETAYRGNVGFDVWLGGIYDVEESGYITGVYVFGWDAHEDAGEQLVTVDIFDEDRNYVGTSEPFLMVDMGWAYATVPNLPFDGTFYAMFHWNKYPDRTMYLGVDKNGPYSNPPRDYIFIDNKWSMYGNGVYMIRVDANVIGKSVSYGYGVKNETNQVNINENAITEILNPLINEVSIVVPESLSFVDIKSNRSFQNVYSIERVRLVFENNKWVIPPESEWTMLSTNVTNTAYTDINANTLPWGRYRWAVSAEYSGELFSAPNFSNIIDIDMFADYKVDIITSGGASTEGAIVTLICQDGNSDHIYTKTDVLGDGSVKFSSETIWRGNYNIIVTLAGHYTNITTGLEITENGNSTTVFLNEYPIPPREVIAETSVDETYVTVTWNAPIIVPTFDDWIKWCTSDNIGGRIGYSDIEGENVTMAIRFTPEDFDELGVVTGHAITKIALGIGIDMEFVNSMEIRIWEGGSSVTNAGNLVYVQPISDFISFPEMAITEITLNTPYYINATKELRIGWNIVNEKGLPFGRDFGGIAAPGKSDLITCPVLNGGQWMSYYQTYHNPPLSLWNFNISIKAYIGYENIITKILMPIANTIDSKTVPAQFKGAPKVLENYNVYRLTKGDYNHENWSIVAENVTEREIIDHEWTDLISGAYQYAVKTVYTNDVLSDATLSNTLIKDAVIYEITVASNNDDWGAVTGSGDYKEGEPVTLTATAENGYKFVNWTEDGTEVAIANPWTFNATADRTIVGNFDIITESTYTITASVDGGNGNITPNGPQTVEHGGSITFTITPDTDFIVDVVKVDGESVELTEESTYTFTNVIADHTIVASFTTVGIRDNILSSVVLYPNPFKNEINISNPSAVKSVQITNASGQKIKSVIFDGKTISTGALTNGIYFVEIESVAGGKTVYKMVKK